MNEIVKRLEGVVGPVVEVLGLTAQLRSSSDGKAWGVVSPDGDQGVVFDSPEECEAFFRKVADLIAIGQRCPCCAGPATLQVGEEPTKHSKPARRKAVLPRVRRTRGGR